jgi:hypothetical protein
VFRKENFKPLRKLKCAYNKMAELLRVMQIIDQNSNVLPEGDYLEVCNLLKKSYETRTDPVYLFNYEDYRIPPVAPPSTFQYFYDYYFDKGVRMDSQLLRIQIRFLEDELDTSQPLKRITKTVRETVRKHCCMINGDTMGELTLEDMNLTPVEFRKMCKTYLNIENDFRSKYRNAIIQRIMLLEESDERLDEW